MNIKYTKFLATILALECVNAQATAPNSQKKEFTIYNGNIFSPKIQEQFKTATDNFFSLQNKAVIKSVYGDEALIAPKVTSPELFFLNWEKYSPNYLKQLSIEECEKVWDSFNASPEDGPKIWSFDYLEEHGKYQRTGKASQEREKLNRDFVKIFGSQYEKLEILEAMHKKSVRDEAFFKSIDIYNELLTEVSCLREDKFGKYYNVQDSLQVISFLYALFAQELFDQNVDKSYSTAISKLNQVMYPELKSKMFYKDHKRKNPTDFDKVYGSIISLVCDLLTMHHNNPKCELGELYFYIESLCGISRYLLDINYGFGRRFTDLYLSDMLYMFDSKTLTFFNALGKIGLDAAQLQHANYSCYSLPPTLEYCNMEHTLYNQSREEIVKSFIDAYNCAEQIKNNPSPELFANFFQSLKRFMWHFNNASNFLRGASAIGEWMFHALSIYARYILELPSHKNNFNAGKELDLISILEDVRRSIKSNDMMEENRKFQIKYNKMPSNVLSSKRAISRFFSHCDVVAIFLNQEGQNPEDYLDNKPENFVKFDQIYKLALKKDGELPILEINIPGLHIPAPSAESNTDKDSTSDNKSADTNADESPNTKANDK